MFDLDDVWSVTKMLLLCCVLVAIFCCVMFTVTPIDPAHGTELSYTTATMVVKDKGVDHGRSCIWTEGQDGIRVPVLTQSPDLFNIGEEIVVKASIIDPYVPWKENGTFYSVYSHQQRKGRL